MLTAETASVKTASRVRGAVAFLTMAATLLVILVTPSPASAATNNVLSFQDVNPTVSFNNAGAGAGGRINGLAISSDRRTFYAASEWGGLYQSTSSALTFQRLNSHRPTTTWDVEMHPTIEQIVYASSWFDGRVASRTESGIQISRNGGATWSRPASAVQPPSAYDCDGNRKLEPAAFGIAVDRANPSDVYIGTNCGVAVSNDAGRTWRFVDPKKAQTVPVQPTGGTAPIVWDVAASGGTVDICSSQRHWRSVDRGATWTRPAPSFTLGTPLPASSAMCSIAISPDERGVMYAFVSPSIYETNDGGVNWRLLDGQPGNDPSPQPQAQGRIPFLTTNDRTTGFDLWFGDVSLHRRPCVTPTNSSQTRCPRRPGGTDGVNNDGDTNIDEPDESWRGVAGDGGGFTRGAGAHDDAGDLVFAGRFGIDACPKLFSSDGGLWFNNRAGDPSTCHDPRFTEVPGSPHAWWVFGMTGSDQPGSQEDLYVGLQDNGLWIHPSAGGTSPQNTWPRPVACCDAFHVATDGARALFTFAGPLTLQVCTRTGVCGVTTQPPPPGNCTNPPPPTPNPGCNLRGFSYAPSVAHFGFDGDFYIATSNGIYQTLNLSSPPNSTATWQLVGTNTPTGGFCSVYVSDPPSFGYTVFAESPVPGLGCRDVPKRVWRFRPFIDTQWSQVPGPSGGGAFGLFAAHPTDPNRMYAAWLPGSQPATASPAMFSSVDGGANWTPDRGLDAALIGDSLRLGTPEFVVRSRTTNRGFSPFDTTRYHQPSLIAFHPSDKNVIIVGGRDAGVFVTTNGGQDWAPLRNPTATVPPIINPVHAYFDLEPAQDPAVFIGTQGMGVWRANLVEADLVLEQLDGGPTVETGGITSLKRGVSNPTSDTLDEVTIFQQLPPGVVFDPITSSTRCLAGVDGAVRCRIGRLAPGAVVNLVIGVFASDDGNQQPDCVDHLAETRAYSNSLESNKGGNNRDSAVLTVCR